jgi:hypothetical protein
MPCNDSPGGAVYMLSIRSFTDDRYVDADGIYDAIVAITISQSVS